MTTRSSQKMTLDQEMDRRSKAFHLLKKWTSLSFLENAVSLYKDFVYAYERQLDTSWPNRQKLEERYTYNFLPYLVGLERGLDSLRTGTQKKEAYGALVNGSDSFSDHLFGRTAYEWGVEHDPFFQALGAREVLFTNPEIAAAYVAGAVKSHLCIEALKCTVAFDFMYGLSVGMRADGGERVFTRWTYESLFQEPPVLGWRDWPPGRTFPAVLTSCPPKNESNEGQVISGDEIPLDGIYEPWFFTGGIGCPNYLLRGQTAHQYQPEGSNDLVPVRWRLLWEDHRYIDGSVPTEEAHYIKVEAEVPTTAISAFSGDPCPQTGNWRSPRLSNRQEYVERGQPMPGPASTPTGSVLWYLQKD